MDIQARGYKLFYTALKKQIEKQSGVFKGVDEFLFEALDLIDKNKLSSSTHNYSKINPNVEFIITSSKDYLYLKDTLKIIFKKNSHLKSFKKLPDYKKKQTIIFEFNVFDSYIKFAQHSSLNTGSRDGFNFASINQRLSKNTQQQFDFKVKASRLDSSFFYEYLLYKKLTRFTYSSNKSRFFVNKNDMNKFYKFFKNISNNLHYKQYDDKHFYVKNEMIETWLDSHVENVETQNAKQREAEAKKQEEQRRREEQKRQEEYKRKQANERHKKQQHEKARAEEQRKKERQKKEHENNRKNEQKNTGSNSSKKAKYNIYQLLGVEPDATFKEIKRSYHKLIRKVHPDISDHPNSTQISKELNNALDILKDPKERKKYNSNNGIKVDVDFNDRAR